MHWLANGLALLVALAIIVIGVRYLVSPTLDQVVLTATRRGFPNRL